MDPRKFPILPLVLVALAAAAGPVSVDAAPPLPDAFSWATVVNNTDGMPGAPFDRTFNSYNQPSVNATGLVVIRARSKGGGGLPATHGIYTRDMSVDGSPIVRILDRTTQVPHPNNLSAKFVETPSFPRIDMWSDTIATRGNHQPVYRYNVSVDTEETRVGTTGIYSNPFGGLITGASKLGAVPGFDFFEVPGADPWTVFDVFPGAPSVTDGKTIVFKGNYTAGSAHKTGVFYRNLEDAEHGGYSRVELIANSRDTLIPGTRAPFGSTSPPSAAGGKAVFAGFDNEENPTLGGLYMADLRKRKKLKRLVDIGERVPGERAYDTFNRLGEGVAFDGRYVGFWGAWNAETEYRTVRLYCPTEGNKDRIAYCNRALVCADTGTREEDPNSICDGTGCYQEKQVPVRQGIFVHDTENGKTRMVATTGEDFDDFVFWNYSGKTPCVGNGHGQEGAEDDGEPARWRSSSFVAVSAGVGATFKAVFKARTGELADGLYVDPVDGIYLGSVPGKSGIATVVETGMNGPDLDPQAPPTSTITEVGLEREGLRGDWLVINAKMGIEGGTEDDGMAGIYLTRVPVTPPR
jgi:hypothetical protein